MLGHLRKSWEWFIVRAEGTHTKAWLAALSFTESCIFIIPPDPLLAAIILAGSRKWLYYGLFTTLFSVLGALFGYILGALFFDTLGVSLIHLYGWESHFFATQKYFSESTFFIVLFTSFTPIPFKVFVLAAGFLKVNIVSFLIATVFGRGIRYTLAAFLVHELGPKAIQFSQKYGVHATIISLIIFVVYIAYAVL